MSEGEARVDRRRRRRYHDSMFDPQTYASRREALLKGLASREPGPGPLLLLGNRESPMNYVDNCYAFRQDSSFLYFVGISTARPRLDDRPRDGPGDLVRRRCHDGRHSLDRPPARRRRARLALFHDATRPRSALARDLASRDLASGDLASGDLAQARKGPREACSTSRPTAPTRAPNSRS